MTSAATTDEADPQHFEAFGYCVVRSALPATSCSLVDGYLAILDKHHRASMIEEAKTGSVGRYADPLGESVLEAVLPTVEARTGLELAPTYSYMRLYRAGAELPRHTDRPACEVSATLYLGGASPSPWPIRIEVDGAPRAIDLAPGDMMIYRGADVPHWRDRFEGERSAHVFLHFVDRNGPNAHLAFDQRESVGAPPRVASPVRDPNRGAGGGSKPSSPAGKIDVEELVRDPSYMLATLDFQKGAAIFRKVDADLPPQNCHLSAKRPGYAVAINNLLEHRLDERVADAKPLHFIWMTDYCLSTLYARALGQSPGLFLYNENAVFSQLSVLRRAIDAGEAKVPRDAYLRLLRTALVFQARAFADGEVPVIKEWPLSNMLMADVFAADPRYRGVFIYAPLEEYLTQTLKRDDRVSLARARVTQVFTDMRRMAPFAGVDFDGLSDAEAAALHWLYLMHVMPGDLTAPNARLASLPNDRFLADPARALSATTSFFGLGDLADAHAATVAGPLFARHAKSPNRPFGPEERARELSEARAAVAPAVEEGLAYAAGITARYPPPDLDAVSLVATRS
ncbi:MAG: hypothetical protein ACFB00_12775 [Parvularculaceae bacterium]